MCEIMDTLEEMAEHTRTHPTHGHGCACKDKYIAKIRRAIKSKPDLLREFNLAAVYISRS